jgi:hypothetical protein
VDGLHKMAGTLRSAAGAARAGDLKRVDAILTAYPDSPGPRELQRADDELSLDR